GWKRQEQTTGTGEETVVQKVTWTGGKVPTGEDAFFQFLASTDAAKTYAFKVRQTYSDGSVVDWSGPESADTPAPSIEARSSLGGGGGSNTLAIIALALGVLALLVAVASLAARSGRRSLAGVDAHAWRLCSSRSRELSCFPRPPGRTRCSCTRRLCRARS